MSTRTPGPPGTLNAWITPGLGANVTGSSALIAALDRVAAELDVALLERQPLARRDPDLFLDDVDAGDELGDRVLDLEAGVGLEEVEVAGRVHQELERAGVGVLHGAGGIDHGGAEPPALLFGQRHRRRFFDQLLVAPLDRALALAQMDDVAVVVAEDLDLDVARRLDVFLEVDVADAERRFGLARARS